MRNAFIETITELAAADQRIWLLCGDLGYSVLERFATRFPDRFVNVGVAEQNMTGLAAGLALAGKCVFTYSIANFATLRCLEQIRNDVAYHGLNVKVVAVGGGVTYGAAGYTHHAVEDLAVMRTLPNMTVVAPADAVETRGLTRALAESPGPAYLRLGKGGEPLIHPVDRPFRLGEVLKLRSGSDVALIATGAALGLAVRAADELQEREVSCAVVSVPTLAPVDAQAIRAVVRLVRRVITVEEHGVGGLASVVAEVMATGGAVAELVPFRLRREPERVAGSADYLRARHGLSVGMIVEAALSRAVTRGDAPQK